MGLVYAEHHRDELRMLAFYYLVRGQHNRVLRPVEHIYPAPTECQDKRRISGSHDQEAARQVPTSGVTVGTRIFAPTGMNSVVLCRILESHRTCISDGHGWLHPEGGGVRTL